MVKVTVEILFWLKKAIDEEKDQKNLFLHETVASGTSILGLMHVLAAKYPGFAREVFDGEELAGKVMVILNGIVQSSLTELDRELKEGDIVTFLPDFYGG